MNNIKNAFSILKGCCNILWKDKELIFIPIFSGTSIIVVFLIWISFFYMHWLYPDGVEILRTQPFHYGIKPYLHWFSGIFAVWFVTTFFQATITASVAKRLSDENPTIISDIRDSIQHLKQITGLVFLISVGIFIMKLFKNKGWLQEIVGEVVEMTVGIACFFVVPIIVIENESPINAIKRSVQLLRNSWGEQIVGNVSLYTLISLFQIPGIILFIFAFKIDMNSPDPLHAPLSIDLLNLSMAGVYIAFTVAAYNTLKEIFRTVLYIYARDGKVPEGFEAESLQQAFGPAV